MGERSGTAMSLLYLRNFRDVNKTELAALLGFKDEKLVSRHETGAKELSRERLEELLEPLRYPPEAVDLLLFTHAFLCWLTEDEEPDDGPPEGLDPEERQRIARTCLTAGWAVAECLRTVLQRQRRDQKRAAERRKATEQVKLLLAAEKEERRELVEIFPEYQGWAVAERLCQESERRAAHDAGEALELAELALAAADRTPEDHLRAAAQGSCQAVLGNALRVATEFDEADAAFSRAWPLWQAGRQAGVGLAEWRMLDLEASLRREQHRFSDSLALLEQARKLVEHDDLDLSRILLKREHVFERMGDFAAALATLEEAAPRVDAAGDLHCRFAHRFNSADILCQLERHEEAAALLPEIQELAQSQDKSGLSWIRVLWLGARIAAGLGQTDPAVRTLELVQREFTERKLAYEAALVSLDIAILLLEAGRTGEVRELAAGMAWIFQAKRIRREALAALTLFCQAAQQEAATAALARQVRAEVQRRGNSPAFRPGGRPKGRA